MEKTELFIETATGRKIFFCGRVDLCNVFHRRASNGEAWELVFYYEGIFVQRKQFPFYPATIVQQLLKSGCKTEIYQTLELDVETYQELLDQNSKR